MPKLPSTTVSPSSFVLVAHFFFPTTERIFVLTALSSRSLLNSLSRAQSSGNSAKSMHISLEASLKKLRTSYVDILYLHWWDWSAGVEEIMQALNRLVVAGKVLYLGVRCVLLLLPT